MVAVLVLEEEAVIDLRIMMMTKPGELAVVDSDVVSVTKSKIMAVLNTRMSRA